MKIHTQNPALRISLIAVFATCLLTPTAEAGFKMRMFWLAADQIKKVGGAVKKGSAELKHAQPRRNLISSEIENLRLELSMAQKALRAHAGRLVVFLMGSDLAGGQSAFWQAGPGDCAWSRDGTCDR